MPNNSVKAENIPVYFGGCVSLSQCQDVHDSLPQSMKYWNQAILIAAENRQGLTKYLQTDLLFIAPYGMTDVEQN